MEKVSIIVPVYNAQKYIARCVDSILNQDYPNIEVILVDDGSKDDSARIIDEKAKLDSRIKVIHKPNGGVSSTRNRGIAEATGTYLQFVDADDYLAEESVKLLVRSMEDDGSDIVVGDFYRVAGEAQSKKGSISTGGTLTRREYADHMLRSPADLYYGVLWNKLYKRSLVEEYRIRMDENISYCEDVIFNLEYLLHVEKISVLTVPIYYYNLTPGSLVEQGTNIPGIIDMKTNVITYYSKFYRDILSPVDYIERIPIIYSYLIAVSTDSFAFKLFNRKEKIHDPACLPLRQSMLLNSRYADALVNKYLNTFVQKYSLDMKEGRLLYCLRIAKQPLTASQLTELTGYSSIQISMSLGKLLTLKYIKRESDYTISGLVETFSVANSRLEQDLDYIEQDCRIVAFRSLSPEKIELYYSLQQEINENIRLALSEEP